MRTVARMILRNLEKDVLERKKPDNSVCLPFYHTFSHNLKALAARHEMSVMFKNDFKLSRLTLFSGGQRGRPKKHREAATGCEEAAVYDMLMVCGFKYVGQSGRCLNDRILEHRKVVASNSPSSEIVKHHDECTNGFPDCTETEVLGKERDPFKRVLRETISITSSTDCICIPSLVMGPDIRSFLGV